MNRGHTLGTQSGRTRPTGRRDVQGVSSDDPPDSLGAVRPGVRDFLRKPVSRPPRTPKLVRELATGRFGDSVNDSIGDDFSLRLAMNGLALYFASNRPGGFGAGDLYVTTRDSLDREWGPAANLGPVLNTAAFEAFPTPSPDGNMLFFNRSTTFDSQDSDIWVTSRSDAHSPWAAPQRLGMPVNGPRAEFSPSISADGLSLYFASDRDGNLGSIDIWVSTRKSAADGWGFPRNLGTNINAAGAMTLAPFITSNNRALYFMSARPDTSSASPCTPKTCFERLDLYVAVATCLP